MSSRFRDFTRMNPPTFYWSKREKDLKDIIYETYNFLYAMGLTTREKADLATYQLKVRPNFVCEME